MTITSYGFVARVIFIVVLGLSFLSVVSAHGYVIQPANRASLWRLGIPGSIVDMDDNQLYCGGFQRQWNFNDGKCGLCGDDYSLPQPRPYENMGARSRGIVAGTYEEGTLLPVTVTITASHKGYFTFHLCKLKGDWDTEDQECFNKHPLELAKGSGYRYHLNSWSPGNYSTLLKLPRGLTCDRCVLRWHYTAGNSLGVCEDGKQAVGCGPQETFRTCSDIAILPKGQIHKRLHVPGFGWKLAKPSGKISLRVLSPVTKNPIHEKLLGSRRDQV